MFGFLFWPLKLLKWALFIAFLTAALVSCLLTITAFYGERSLAWDLTSHFRVLYLISQVGALGLLVFIRMPLRPLWVGVIGFFALLNLSQVGPYYMPRFDARGQGAPTFSLLQMNVWAENKACDQAVAYAREQNPDVLALEELTVECHQRFVQAGLGTAGWLPNGTYLPGERMGIFSRFPLTEYKSEDRPKPGVAGRLRFDGRVINIGVVHPTRPYFPEFPKQIRQVAVFGESLPRPTILVGDFNTTPWSSDFASVLEISGLRDAALGYGDQPTYPSRLPFTQWPLLPVLAIDHILLSEEFYTRAYRVGPDIGSDHRPVWVELGIDRL